MKDLFAELAHVTIAKSAKYELRKVEDRRWKVYRDGQQVGTSFPAKWAARVVALKEADARQEVACIIEGEK